MLSRLLPLIALILGLLALPGVGRRARHRPPPPGEPAPATRRPMPPARSRRRPAAQPSEAGFSREFAERLAASSGALTAADREDRAALAASTQAASTSPSGSARPASRLRREAVIGEIRRADDWGLDAVGVPAAGPDGAGRVRAFPRRAGRCRDRSEPRHPEICAPRARQPRRSHLEQFLDRKLPLLEPQQVIDAAAKAASARCLPALPAPAASAVRGAAPEIPGPEARPAGRAGRPARPRPTRNPARRRPPRPRHRTRASCSSTWKSGAGCRSRSATSTSGSTSPSSRCASSRTARSSTPSASSSASATRRRRYSPRTWSR